MHDTPFRSNFRVDGDRPLMNRFSNTNKYDVDFFPCTDSNNQTKQPVTTNQRTKHTNKQSVV